MLVEDFFLSPTMIAPVKEILLAIGMVQNFADSLIFLELLFLKMDFEIKVSWFQ
jgi:hypothetical protein